MSGYGMLFPGQGSQKPGMGKEFYDAHERVKQVFNTAESVLKDCSVKSLCFEADEEELRKTENTQPALYTVSYAIYSVLEQAGYRGEVFAGHSLGEYTAVTAAGFLDFSEGLRVVRTRGLLMRDCDPDRKGGMAAILGLEADEIDRVCRETGEVWPANFNSPGQIVISGTKEKVNEAMEKLKTLGAKRAVVLNVGGPFHSPFMKEAADRLKRELESAHWKKGRGKIISNATGVLTDDPAKLEQGLVAQLSSPVLWSSSMSTLVRMGYTKYIESGPGTVLRGLFRSISKEAEVYSVERPSEMEALAG